MPIQVELTIESAARDIHARAQLRRLFSAANLLISHMQGMRVRREWQGCLDQRISLVSSGILENFIADADFANTSRL